MTPRASCLRRLSATDFGLWLGNSSGMVVLRATGKRGPAARRLYHPPETRQAKIGLTILFLEPMMPVMTTGQLSLVTGGGGFVGRALVDALVARGDRVIVAEPFA